MRAKNPGCLFCEIGKATNTRKLGVVSARKVTNGDSGISEEKERILKYAKCRFPNRPQKIASASGVERFEKACEYLCCFF